ncbi:MAG: SGNH/GDSL hydrolase family protein [Bacteroidaceae bacterium]|nr:SGNH/GDSL hydrolase family protein [Bacteroidaceae bacterium]MBP3832869.1 SGNH/GDSL hydrolase family protein [Bacteroidaceae bacterium]
MAKNNTTGGVLMKTLTKFAALFVLLCSSLSTTAQDALPVVASIDRSIETVDSLALISEIQDTLPLPLVPTIPRSFQQTRENQIIDTLGVLTPFWEKVKQIRRKSSNDILRVLHVGDSHIRGHILPRTTGDSLQLAIGRLTYSDMGINGATCETFSTPERIRDIQAEDPDLLILSFGTNESHNRGYNALRHYQQMETFVRMLRTALPGVPILMTTPPGSYQGRRRAYSLNPRTAIAVQTIHRFAHDNGIAVWDLFTIMGGGRRACLNWQSAKMMRPDHVHYTVEGYVFQGQLLYHAIVKAYNDYVGFR